MTLRYLISFLILTQLSVFSQELPPIEVFKPKDYGAEDQNWGISQGNDKSIYFANNKGLLMYNGARWKLYNLADDPSESIDLSSSEPEILQVLLDKYAAYESDNGVVDEPSDVTAYPQLPRYRSLSN